MGWYSRFHVWKLLDFYLTLTFSKIWDFLATWKETANSFNDSATYIERGEVKRTTNKEKNLLNKKKKQEAINA